MERIPEFMANNPLLCMGWMACLAMLIWTFVSGTGRGIRKVTPLDATRLINDQDAIVVDVRADGEFNGGHILNSVHIPVKYLKDQLNKLEKYRERPIIVACRTGQTSTNAFSVLKQGGFDQIYHLQGGILAWEGANLPLMKR